MRLVILLLMTGCTNALISAQSFMKADYFMYEDQSFIDSFTVHNKIDKYIIYQTYFTGDSLGPGETANDLVSFLIWKEKETTYIKMIAQAKVYEAIKVDSVVIFNDKNLNKLWVEKNEDVLKFVPSVLAPLNDEIILYINKNRKYFYVNGGHGYYKEDLAKKMYREEFVVLLRKIIIPWIKNVQVEGIYNRPDLFLREN